MTTRVIGRAGTAGATGADVVVQDGDDMGAVLTLAVQAVGPGGTVTVRDGTYPMSSGFSTSVTGYTLTGSGAGCVLQTRAGVTSSLTLLTVTTPGASVSGFALVGNRGNSNANVSGVYLSATGAHVSGLSVTDTQFPFEASGAVDSTVSQVSLSSSDYGWLAYNNTRCSFSSVSVTSCGYAPFYSSGNVDCQYWSPSFNNSGSSATSVGGMYLYAENNTFVSGGGGNSLGTSVNEMVTLQGACVNCVIDGMYIVSNYDYAIGATSTDQSGHVFSFNYVEQAPAGNSSRGNEGIAWGYANFSKMVVFGNYLHGATYGSGYAAIFNQQYTDHSVIAGNTVDNTIANHFATLYNTGSNAGLKNSVVAYNHLITNAAMQGYADAGGCTGNTWAYNYGSACSVAGDVPVNRFRHPAGPYKCGSYSPLDGDFVLADAGGGNITQTLPGNDGARVMVKRIDSSSNTCTLVDSAGGSFADATQLAPGEAAWLLRVSGTWMRVGHDFAVAA